MTPDCAYYLPYIFTLIFGLVVSKQIHVDPDSESIHEKYLAKNPFLPTFLTTSGNVTVFKGETAILPCAIEHRGTRTVVWRLRPNPSPITIGVKTYVSDTRFKVVHPKHSLEWNLHIMNAQPHDSGIYECQVSAVARDIRQLMLLRVRDSTENKRKKEITIKGSFFVERGDALKLECNATGSAYAPDEIDWFKDGNTIKNSDHIVLVKHVFLAERTITSTLLIKRGHMADAGTYVCRTSDLQVTSVKVNILNTESNNEKRDSLDSSIGKQTGDDTGDDTGHGGTGHDNSGDRLQLSRESWIVLLVLVVMTSYSRCFVL